MKKNYYVFIGQNATTGEPNPRTGRMSKWGDVSIFESKREALLFAAEKETGNAQDVIVAGTKRTIREFCLGVSVAQFEENIEMSPVMKRDGDSWVETF